MCETGRHIDAAFEFAEESVSVQEGMYRKQREYLVATVFAAHAIYKDGRLLIEGSITHQYATFTDCMKANPMRRLAGPVNTLGAACLNDIVANSIH
jgi:hypothetical protein